MESDKIRHIFKPNSYFENAVDLYEFDRDLRELIFTAIQAIEFALRSTLLSNHPNVETLLPLVSHIIGKINLCGDNISTTQSMKFQHD